MRLYLKSQVYRLCFFYWHINISLARLILNFANKSNYTVMTDYEYILQQAKLFHYKGWEDSELRKCVDMLPNLSRRDLGALYRSKWIADEKIIKQAIFNILFKDQIGKREERIKTEDLDLLIQEFQDKKGGNVALARKELRERYKAGKDKQKIAGVFNASTKADQQWVKSQIRKEMYGESNNNYRWRKPSWK